MNLTNRALYTSIVLLITIFIASFLIFYVNQRNFSDNPSEVIGEGNKANSSSAVGVIVLAPDTDALGFEQNFQVPKETSKFLIVDNSEFAQPKYFVIADFANRQIRDLFINQKNSEIVRHCIEFSFDNLIKQNKDQDSSLGYYDLINFVRINNFQVLADMNCYSNYPAYSKSEEIVTLPGKYQINATQRPAYDIGYDYSITMPYKEASLLGYGDASGYSEQERSQINNGMVDIPLTFNGSEVLRRAEEARRVGKPVSLIGSFGWGYAESMPFHVEEISE